MKSRFAGKIRGAVVVLALALPLSAGPLIAGMAEDKVAIRDIWSTYSAARVAGDAETWLALWDAGGLQMPPGMPARGLDVLMVGVPKVFAAGGVTSMTIDPIEIEVAGDWAYTRGAYASERIVDGNPVMVDGKFMTILRRQDDGSWKIYRDIFNSNK